LITEPSAPNPGGRRSQWLADYQPRLRISEIGKLAAIGDGIAWIEGLPSAAMDQILRFENGSEALVFHLGSRRIGGILLGQEDGLAAGAAAHLTGRRLDIGVGDGFLGRVVDPLGNPLDGGAATAIQPPTPPRSLLATDHRPRFRQAPIAEWQQDGRYHDPDW
jgi:F-type H+-transporting ATPase subunit alpha